MGRARKIKEVIEDMSPCANRMIQKLGSKEAGIGYATALTVRDNPTLMETPQEIYKLIEEMLTKGV